MAGIFDKIRSFISKIGKPNFILILFVLFVLGIAGLYRTFSLSTISEGAKIIDNVLTYQFILNNKEENSVTIAGHSSKNLLITVENPENLSLKYGIYYYSSDDLSSVSLGYLKSSGYKGVDVISAKSSYGVAVKIENHNDDNVNISFGISYGVVSGGDLMLEEGRHWLGEAVEPVYLNKVPVGSYVKYTGDNGCSGDACSGKNVNYVSDEDMGYCSDSQYKFSKNGWRVGYINEGSAYLVSAGAIECLATDASGEFFYDEDISFEQTVGAPAHLANLNQEALKYCNNTYAYDGICDNHSVWAMNSTDFEKIVGENLSSSSCFEKPFDLSCGYGNDLIDNGGFYWIASAVDSTSSHVFSWNASSRFVSHSFSNALYGVRPVLRLQSSVMVYGGRGTYDDPYILESNLSK